MTQMMVGAVGEELKYVQMNR